MKSTLRTIALAIAVASFVSGSAFGQGITLGRPGQAPLCTHTALHAGTCQQAVAGYHATVTNANGAAEDPCASDAGTGSAQVTCRYVTGSGWKKWEPGEGGGGANLSSSVNATTATVASDSGTDATIPAATPSAAGVMGAADKAKLDGIEVGASADMTDAEILAAWEAETGRDAAADGVKLDADHTFYCDQYAGADLWEKCNAALAAARAASLRGTVLQIGRGSFTNNGAMLDACDERGGSIQYPIVIRGLGGGTPSAAATRIIFGSGYASPVVNKNGGTYTITANVDSDGGGPDTILRDEITCSACDFRAAGIRRGDLIETTGFADTYNNYPRFVAGENEAMPLKVYRAEPQKLILESESHNSLNATLAAPSGGNPTSTGDVRWWKPGIQTCGSHAYVQDLTLNGQLSNFADILIHHKPDIAPYLECTAEDVPYAEGAAGPTTDPNAYCTGAGTGTASMNSTGGVNGGVHRVYGYGGRYGVAITALEASGQADHYALVDTHMVNQRGAYYYDSAQAQPGIELVRAQAEGFKQFGFRVGSGTGILNNSSIISVDSDCVADAFGACSHVYLGFYNVHGFYSKGKNNLEVRAGSGIKVEPGGSVETARRTLDLSGMFISANSGTAETDMKLVDAANACLSVDLSNTRFSSNSDPVNAPTVTFGNANQATCPTYIDGKWTVANTGGAGTCPQPGGCTPIVTINNNIPTALFSNDLDSIADLTARLGLTGTASGSTFLRGDGVWTSAGGVGGDITSDPAWAAAGDLIVGDGDDSASVLSKGTEGQVLKVVSGAVAWGTDSTGGSPAFSDVGAGTNANALVVGTGGSLGVSGSGTIAATSAAAMSGSGQIDDDDLAAGAVDGGLGGEIADGSITADDLGADSVSASELNATGVEAELEAVLDLQDLQGAVTDAQVPNSITIDLAATAAAMSGSGQIDDNDLAAGAVDGGTGGEIADDSITAADIAANAVTASELADNAVDTGAIVDDAVTPAKVDATGDFVFGSVSTVDRTTEPGNRFTLNDNDTAFANDPTCANSGSAGLLTIIDKDESASDSWVICDGTSELVDLGALGGGGAPTTADYLVGTANGSLSAEIVVGTSPGGELGGTWASPTLDDGVSVTGWDLGASAATTPSADDSDTSVATTAYVQGEINGAGGAGLACSSGVCALATSEASSISSGTSAPANDGALVIDTNGGTGVTNDVLAFQSGGEDFFVFAVREYPTTNGQVLKYNSANADVEWAADSTGGSPTFDSIASGTNTTATMIVGSGGSMLPTGTGAIFATGVVASAGSSPTASGSVAYDSTSNTLEYGENGTNRTVANLDGTQTFTNKTLNAEATGNVVVIPERVWFPAAGCNGSTAGPFYDLPASGAAAPACVTGTNTQKGVLDFDAASDEAGQITQMLPIDWTGQLDVRFKWFAAATSGSVVWAVQTVCVADAETDDPAFNAANTVTDAAKGTTLQLNDATVSTLTITGCAAGELLHLRISRDADNGADDMTGDARLIGVELTYRRAA